MSDPFLAKALENHRRYLKASRTATVLRKVGCTAEQSKTLSDAQWEMARLAAQTKNLSETARCLVSIIMYEREKRDKRRKKKK